MRDNTLDTQRRGADAGDIEGKDDEAPPSQRRVPVAPSRQQREQIVLLNILATILPTIFSRLGAGMRGKALQRESEAVSLVPIERDPMGSQGSDAVDQGQRLSDCRR